MKTVRNRKGKTVCELSATWERTPNKIKNSVRTVRSRKGKNCLWTACRKEYILCGFPWTGRWKFKNMDIRKYCSYGNALRAVNEWKDAGCVMPGSKLTICMKMLTISILYYFFHICNSNSFFSKFQYIIFTNLSGFVRLS